MVFNPSTGIPGRIYAGLRGVGDLERGVRHQPKHRASGSGIRVDGSVDGNSNRFHIVSRLAILAVASPTTGAFIGILASRGH